MTVLVVEDDEIIAEGLRYSLMSEGYEVLLAGTAAETYRLLGGEGAGGCMPGVNEAGNPSGIRAREAGKPSGIRASGGGRQLDFCLLDVILPDGNGFDICRWIRETSPVPVLFLTACDDEVSTVRALELGADDYIAKPFRIRELLARMKAILRRTSKESQAESQIAAVGRNQVNLRTGKVYCGNDEVILTAMEYKLLLIFLNHRGQVLTRNQILDQIWDGAGEYVNDNTLTVYVGRLRKKLGDTESVPLIETVRGSGYRMRR